jgi:nicotinic acid mononucleotide adenylyltransferase
MPKHITVVDGNGQHRDVSMSKTKSKFTKESWPLKPDQIALVQVALERRQHELNGTASPVHDGVYAEAGKDSSGDSWDAQIIFKDGHWYYNSTPQANAVVIKGVPVPVVMYTKIMLGVSEVSDDQGKLVQQAIQHRRAELAGEVSTVTDGVYARATHDGNGYDWNAEVLRKNGKWWYRSSPTKKARPLTGIPPILGGTAVVSGVVTDCRDVKSARDMFSCYNNHYEPPSWSLDQYVSSNAKEFLKLAKQAFVVVHAGTDMAVVHDILTEREPVNIGMKTHFKVSKFEKLFGFKIAGYTDYYNKNGHLAPNLAVYTRIDAATKGNPGTPTLKVHVLHAIGYALDSHKQADYKDIVKNATSDVTANLYAKYVAVFQKMFGTAAHLKLDTLVTGLVGGNNFAGLYPGSGNTSKRIEKFQRDVWAPAFYAVSSTYPHIKVVFTDQGKSSLPQRIIKKKYGVTFGSTKWVPEAFSDPQFDLTKTLFVNAWDPLSAIGNGNCSDHSADGAFGCHSNSMLLGWPVTNPYLLNRTLTIKAGKSTFKTGHVQSHVTPATVEPVKQAVQVVYTGAFNPITKGHTDAVQAIIDTFDESKTMELERIIMSTSHDEYTIDQKGKILGVNAISGLDRLALMKVAISTFTPAHRKLVKFSDWEVKQHHFIDYPDVCRHFSDTAKPGVATFFAVGEDNYCQYLSTSKPKFAHGLVVLQRDDDVTSTAKCQTARTKAKKKDYVVWVTPPTASQSFSSTAARKALKNGNHTIAVNILGEAVVDAIFAQDDWYPAYG